VERKRRTARIYIAECAAEYLTALLVTGSFLAKLTDSLGFSDTLTAILTAFVSLGSTFQLLSIFFFRGGKVKKKIIGFFLANETLFALLYLLPGVSIPSSVKTVLFVIFIFGGRLFLNVSYAPKTSWYMSNVDNDKRGVFSANKEMISLLAGTVFSFVMGNIIDRMEAGGQLRQAFVVMAATLLGLMVIHLLLLLFSHEEDKPAAKDESFFVRMASVMRDKRTRSTILIAVIWSVATHVSTPFYGTYAIKELGLSMTVISLITGAVYSAFRIIFSFLWGKIADKASFARMATCCFIVAFVAFSLNSFTVPANGKVFYTAYYILYAISMGGINSALMNLVLDYAPEEMHSDALAVKGTVAGLAGFLATLAVTPLVDWIQNRGNRFLGMNLYAQQVVSALAAVLLLGLVIYLGRLCKKEQRNTIDK